MRSALPGVHTLVFAACSSSDTRPAPFGGGVHILDTGIPGPDGGVWPPPPRTVRVSGRVIGMGDALAGTVSPVEGASMLTVGVTSEAWVVTDAQGSFRLNAPANGQVIVFSGRMVGTPKMLAELRRGHRGFRRYSGKDRPPL